MLIKSAPTIAILLATTMIPISSSYVIAEENNPLSLSVEIGAEHESNITVDELDITSQLGDEAALLDGAIGYDIVDDGHMTLTAGYNFSQSLHLDLSEFDLQIHGASLEATTKVNDVDLGIAYRYSNIKLGSESFLVMHSIHPNFITMIGSKLLMIGGYEYQKHEFQQVALRDRGADRHSVNAKVYFLLGKGRTLNMGYKISHHNTVASELVYWGHTFDLGLKFPIETVEGAKFSTRYRYRQKDYSNITPSLGENRADKRHSIRARLEAPVFQRFTAKLQYEYMDSSSNLETLNYANHLITFTIGWEL